MDTTIDSKEVSTSTSSKVDIKSLGFNVSDVINDIVDANNKIEADTVQTKSVVLPLTDLSIYKTYNDIEDLAMYRRNQAILFDIPGIGLCCLSDKFWKTWCQFYEIKQSKNLFRVVPHSELFKRIQKLFPSHIKLTVELWPHNNRIAGKVLALTKADRSNVSPDLCRSLTKKYTSENQLYLNGYFSSEFKTPFPLKLTIGDEAFESWFKLTIPVDGYGVPSAHLSLRSSQGTHITAMDSAFKKPFQVANDDNHLYECIVRNLESFQDDDGFDAFKDRLETAKETWASFEDWRSCSQSIVKACTRDAGVIGKLNGARLDSDLMSLCGEPLQLWGVTSSDSLSKNQAKNLPIWNDLYSLIKYAGEAATHQLLTSPAKEIIQRWIGQKLTTTYDLEGTKEIYEDFSSFYAVVNTPFNSQ